MKLTATDQTNPRSDAYSSIDYDFTYSPFTVEPRFCAMTMSCNNVDGPSDKLTCRELSNDNTLGFNFTPNDYTVNELIPGDYVYEFDVSTGDTEELTKQFTFTVTLDEPCHQPIIVKPVTSEQSYTITDLADADGYALSPAFSVTPDFCASSISFTAPGLDSNLVLDEES